MSTSIEMWRHLPPLFRRSLYCTTCPVVEQLRRNSCHLRTLRLVGIEDQYNVLPLVQALQSNMTLETVTICSSFLSTISVEADDPNEHTLLLFQAIGRLASLTRVVLEGRTYHTNALEHAGSFPVSAITTLLLASSGLSSSLLQDLSLQDVELVVRYDQHGERPPQNVTVPALQELAMALEQCRSLKKVSLTGLRVQDRRPNTNHNQDVHLLDPIVLALRHCEHVDVSMRKDRHQQQRLRPPPHCYFSPALLATFCQSNSLKHLWLGSNTLLQESHLASILAALLVPSTELETLVLADVHPTSSSGSRNGWKTLLSRVFQINQHLERLDLTFVADPIHNVESDRDNELGGSDNHRKNCWACSLQRNETLQRLTIRGLDEQNIQCWVDLLEQHNVSMQELSVLGGDDNGHQPTSKTTQQHRQILDFYLHLNRQRLRLNNDRSNDIEEGEPSQHRPTILGLRQFLLRQVNGNLRHDLVVPVILAARSTSDKTAVGASLAHHEDTAATHAHGNRQEQQQQPHQPNNESSTKEAGDNNYGLSALFYLFTNLPSILATAKALPDVVARPKPTPQRQDAVKTHLLFLDDGIVELW